jgi:hypothetical protein
MLLLLTSNVFTLEAQRIAFCLIQGDVPAQQMENKAMFNSSQELDMELCLPSCLQCIAQVI